MSIFSPRSATPWVILISRKGKGIGGMQHLSYHLSDQVKKEYTEQAKVFTSTGFLSLALLPARFVVTILMSPKSSRVHFCDAALIPLGAMGKLLRPDLHFSVTVSGLDILYPAIWYQWLLGLGLQSIDVFVAVSTSTKDKLLPLASAEQRVVVIPCGINSNRTYSKSPKDTHTLITVGRLIKRKGIAWFIEHVFPLLRERYPSIRYVVVGSGPERKNIEVLLKKKNLQQSVDLYGKVSSSVRDDLLSQSSVFVMPNIAVEGDIEGFGIVCIEASSMGLQVAAANIEGIQDAVIDGKTGRFFTSKDREDCLHVISSLLESPLDPASVSGETLRRYSWDDLFTIYKNDVFGL